MINFLITWTLTFRPVHMIYDDLPSCGAEERFLKEKIQITIADGTIRSSKSIKWEIVEKVDGYYLARYKASPNAYMSMSLLFDEFDGYMTIKGIDAKRNPCADTVYFKRAR